MGKAKFLSRFASLPKDPVKSQMAAIKRQLQPKPVHKLIKPRKLIGSISPIPPRTLRG